LSQPRAGQVKKPHQRAKKSRKTVKDMNPKNLPNIWGFAPKKTQKAPGMQKPWKWKLTEPLIQSRAIREGQALHTQFPWHEGTPKSPPTTPNVDNEECRLLNKQPPKKPALTSKKINAKTHQGYEPKNVQNTWGFTQKKGKPTSKAKILRMVVNRPFNTK